jgi:hypothetical protein
MTTAAPKGTRLDQQAPLAPVGIPGARPITIKGKRSIQFPKYKPSLADVEKIMKLLDFPNFDESSCMALKVMDSKLSAQISWSISFSEEYFAGYSEQDLNEFARTTIDRFTQLAEFNAFAEAKIAAFRKVMSGSFDRDKWNAISDCAVDLSINLDFTNLKNWQRAEPYFSSGLR